MVEEGIGGLPSSKSLTPRAISEKKGPRTKVEFSIINSMNNRLHSTWKIFVASLLETPIYSINMLTKFSTAGNIRVFCRIRPISGGENFGHFRPVVALDSSNVLLRLTDNKSKSYSFDKVFHPGSSQGAWRISNFFVISFLSMVQNKQ